MSSQGVTYNGQCALSSVFPSIFSPVNTYTLMIQINDASAIRELVRVNDSFNTQDEINNIFPKNCGNLFQFYINVDGLDHLNGFYDFDDLLCGLGKISEDEYYIYGNKLNDIKEERDNHEELTNEMNKSLEQMNITNPVLTKVLNEQMEEIEERLNNVRYKFIEWEDQEQLLEHICINLRKCVYWFFFNENQQKQYKNGQLFKPRISNESIELFDSIFNQSAQLETITNKQLNKHLTEYEVVNEICENYQKQRIEYGETIELMESEEEEEEEEEEESEWETSSIDENENPDKSNTSSELTVSTDSEDDEEPLKIDECKTCKNYAYLIEELRQKDKKIANLHEIIRAQDKQIEEHDEENDSDEENEWEAQYNGLKESYDEYIEETEKAKTEAEYEYRTTVIEYALRVNALIDEVRELRKKQNLSTDNI